MSTDEVDAFAMKERLQMLKDKSAGSFLSVLKRLTAILSLSSVVLVLYACPGAFSDKPPLHPNPNMDFQPKKNAQSLPLQVPEGVVAFGSESGGGVANRAEFLREDLAFYYGLTASEANFSSDLLENVKRIVAEGNNEALPNGVRFASRIPSEIEVGRALIIEGYRRFEIYCAVCHGRTGVGDGPVVERRVGMPQPPDLSSAAVIALSDGEIFNVISHGRRNMPAYAKQINVRDRWAIISYVRSLQHARSRKLSDVQEDVRRDFLKWDEQRKEALKQQEEENKNP